MGNYLHRPDRHEIFNGTLPSLRPTHDLTETQDLLVDPSTRDANDVSHKITAIGSRSTTSAQKFLDDLKSSPSSDPASWGPEHGGLEGCKAYGSYEEVYADPVCSRPRMRV